MGPETQQAVDSDEEPAAPHMSLAQMRVAVASVMKYVKGHRTGLVIGVVLSLLGVFVDAATTTIYGKLVDQVLTPADFGPFPRIAGIYAGLALTTCVLDWCSQYGLSVAGEGFTRDLRSSLFHHVMGMSAGFFDTHEPGDVMERINGDVDGVEVFAVSGVESFLNAAFRITVFVAYLIWLDPLLAGVSLVAAPIVVVAMRLIGGRLARIEEEARVRASNLTDLSEQSITSEADVRAFGWRDALTARFDHQGARAQRAAISATKASELLEGISHMVQIVAALAVIGFAVWQLHQHVITLGTLLVFLGLVVDLYDPISELGGLGASLAAAAVSARRIDELLSAESGTPEPVVAGPAPAHPTGLDFEDVSFTYPDRAAETLHHISFHLAPGRTYALVGDSGAGKSSIAKLAHRAYDPTTGRVLLGGRDLRTLTAPTLADTVAAVSQTTTLLDTTIRANVAAARPEATDEELDQVLHAAGLDTATATLPDGLDTQVGSHGRTLSGGQRQRVALARALLRRTPVLLLDEPTTGLDDHSSAAVAQTISRLHGSATILIITHDRHLAAVADQTLHISDGTLTTGLDVDDLDDADTRRLPPIRPPRRALPHRSHHDPMAVWDALRP